MGGHGGQGLTAFQDVQFAAFKTLRGFTDAQCKAIELALIELAANRHASLGDAGVLRAYNADQPDRAFRLQALETLRRLMVRLIEGRKSADDYSNAVDGWLKGAPALANEHMRAEDFARYVPVDMQETVPY